MSEMLCQFFFACFLPGVRPCNTLKEGQRRQKRKVSAEQGQRWRGEKSEQLVAFVQIT